MEAAVPISLLKTSMFKNTYSSMQSTGGVSRVEPLVEEHTPFSTNTILNDTTTHNITPKYTVTTNTGSNSQKYFTGKAFIMSVILTTNINPVLGSNSSGAITDSAYHVNILVENSIKEINSKTETVTTSIGGKGIELGEAKTYNKSETATSEKEEIFMLQEMYGSIIKFENMILKLSYLLTIAFLVLALPIFLGYSSLVGVVMSLGLLLYVKIRRWERSEIYGRKSH